MLRRSGIAIAVALGLLLGTDGGPARADDRMSVDVELVLAADGSGSIDEDEFRLQRNAYAEAIESPEVLGAIAAGINGRIALLYMEWGGPGSQHVIVDWTVIEGPASAAVFARALRTAPRAAWGYNSISAAVDRSVALIEENQFAGLKRVIDVSGDGPNIGGPPMVVSRDAAVARGITINALAISRPGGSARMSGPVLMDHYATQVIGGMGAFVMGADSAQPFATAVRRKLVQEIASLVFLNDLERRRGARAIGALPGVIR